MSKKDYGAALPYYRAPQRQIVFDDAWNLAANPVQIRRRIDTLNGDLTTNPSKHFSYWRQAGDFQKPEGAWGKYGTAIRATYGDFGGNASTDFPIDQPGEYSVWVRFSAASGYYAPWTVSFSNPGGATISWNHNDKSYPTEWHKIGVVKMREAGKMSFAIAPTLFKYPGTYRLIHDFLITTDITTLPVAFRCAKAQPDIPILATREYSR